MDISTYGQNTVNSDETEGGTEKTTKFELKK